MSASVTVSRPGRLCMTTSTVDEHLSELLRSRRRELRPPETVMAPSTLGATRLSRYSFNRTMLRRASVGEWSVSRPHFDIDDEGRGEAVYRVDTGDRVFGFVAFTTTLDESLHTDRVIADRWEIAAALVEGEVDGPFLDQLREHVPKQEGGRHDPRVLVLTRGNRSVRFFDYLVDTLAAGSQPDPALVGDAGYIMRSTAFYGNGKYGMRSFEGYPPGHPLSAPYRAQMLAAWLFRELSYDVTEECARRRGGERAVAFNAEWSRFFGLGNATGLGLVPYAFNHPRVLNAWIGVRELALANVRALDGTPNRVAQLRRWIDRAHQHFSEGTDADCTPFLSPQQLLPVVESIRDAFELVADHPQPFDDLMKWASSRDAETSELTVSLLIELDTDLDDLVDELLLVDEQTSVDPAMTVGMASLLLEERFGWLDELDLEGPGAAHFSWFVSDNADEPRRAVRGRIEEEAQSAVAIDVALRMVALRRTLLLDWTADALLSEVTARHPEHLLAIERLIASDRPYGEPRDNTCAAEYLPLQVQRLQLAMYGMDNFKPKSTDWLRVTLFQGAPRCADLTNGLLDDWVFPALPAAAQGAQ